MSFLKLLEGSETFAADLQGLHRSQLHGERIQQCPDHRALWTKFDISALTKGAEDFDKQGGTSLTHVTHVTPLLQQAGVPLIQQLKSDAIRKGHWEELMTLAEVESEDFDIKKMTLNAVFAMQLHRFPDEVNELVAQNELKIESELAKVQGHTFGSKRLDTIKRWEKNLSVVSEVNLHKRLRDAFRKVAEGDKNAMKNELKKENQQVQDDAWQGFHIVNTLIILDVHARDIVDRFVRDSEMSARRAVDSSKFGLIDGSQWSTWLMSTLQDEIV
eukprot:Skav216999  [mRNA]  locus=scaffold1803:29837:36641:+ [translate_table: standard]